MSHNFLTCNFSCKAGKHAFLKSLTSVGSETISWLSKVQSVTWTTKNWLKTLAKPIKSCYAILRLGSIKRVLQLEATSSNYFRFLSCFSRLAPVRVTSFNVFSMIIHPKNVLVCRKYNNSSYEQSTDNKGWEV